jgi:hypothetical protein
MKHVTRCHDFPQSKKCDEGDIENIGEEHDAAMGEKSCQPEGLRPTHTRFIVLGALMFRSGYGARETLSS